LVEKPPRERPSASPEIPLFAGPASAGGVLMSAHHARIHKVHVPVEQASGIRLGLQDLEHALPEAFNRELSTLLILLANTLCTGWKCHEPGES
jgi:hypothetical protein